MADITANDVTVTVEHRSLCYGVKPIRLNRCKVVFGNGVLTYPAGGIPLPSKDKFGLATRMDWIQIVDENDGDGIVWKWDKENNKLRGYVQGVAVGAAGAAVLDDYPATAGVGVSSGLSVGLAGVTGPATAYTGALKELRGATDAPAATTLYVVAAGA